MKLTVILAALALVVLASNAEARPVRTVSNVLTVGCSDQVMRPCGTGSEIRSYSEEITKKRLRHRRFSPDLDRKEITHHNTSRPRAWCGWWLGRHLGMPSRTLWRALAWRHVGRAAHGPAIGVVVVWARGKGSGHVGIITGRTSKGWVVKSGNDGNAIRERARSVSNAIAFRWP